MSCHNADRWLREAIDSVLAQTFEDYEFMIVDDGSTDETWKIIQSYRDRDERIVAISKNNTGLADSLNVGIAHARGKWIARLDADDLCETKRLEEQMNFVRKHADVILLGTGFLEIDENSRVIKRHIYPTNHQVLLRHLERLQRFFPHSSAFYRSDTARQVGGYNKRFHRAQDRRLWLEMSMRGQIACLPIPLVRNRKHTAQISNDDRGRRQLFYGSLATICHFMQKAGYKDPSVNGSENEWNEFLSWVEKRIQESGVFERRSNWANARALYFAAGNKLAGAFSFGTALLQSGYANALIRERFFGSCLPQRLAWEWIERSHPTL